MKIQDNTPKPPEQFLKVFSIISLCVNSFLGVVATHSKNVLNFNRNSLFVMAVLIKVSCELSIRGIFNYQAL